MLITIDSNIDNMAKAIAGKLIIPAKLWCTALNKCSLNNIKSHEDINKSNAQPSISKSQTSNPSQARSHSDEQNHTCPVKYAKNTALGNAKIETRQYNKRNVFYNTPISLADDIKPYKFNLESNGMFFVYLDSTKQELAYNRILNNLKNIPNPILLLNSRMPTNTLSSPIAYIIDTGNCDLQNIADLISTIVSTHMFVGRRVGQQEMLLMCQPTKNKPSRLNLNLTAIPQSLSSSISTVTAPPPPLSSSSSRQYISNRPTSTATALVKQTNASTKPEVYDIYDVLDPKTTNNLSEIDDCHECL
ncbi:GrBNV gp81-like protein-like protein [Mauternbach virus]|uniref:GrBNV gp81-like protein-like protein n=1 Tax=Mauternbach virus TaxID=2486603 RepID=A0A3G3E646_9VIRU|nr:GrBNV gp81-like protein-like protein [Mauternbach virus]AYP97942.1 GrBNV gp81-like protein-like protein [Mauternbach virus]